MVAQADGSGAPSPDKGRAEAWAGDWRSRAKPTARMTTGRTGVVGIDTGAERAAAPPAAARS